MSQLARRRPARTRRAALACLGVVALVAAFLLVPVTAQAAQPVDEVHYSFTSRTSVAINWRGDANDVRWGTDTSYGNTAQGVVPQWTPWSSAGPFWQLELGSLTPGTTYHYSIGGGPDYTFHTAPTGSFRFDAVGDIGDTVDFSKLGDTLSSIASDDPSFVFMLGDLSYANSVGSATAVDQHFNDAMNSFGTRAAYMPAWGNHEWETPSIDDLRNYKGRLLMPNAQTSPGSPTVSCCGNDWGWFDAGPVRFINYPEPWSGAWADWKTKASALMAQAQNDPSVSFIVTYGHRPAYSTGVHTGEAGLRAMLDDLGSTYNKYVLNLSGHDHDYERFQPIQGVTHMVLGAASSLATPWSTSDSRTAFRAMHLSHLRADVSSNGMRLQAICDAPTSKDDTTCVQGSVLDEYTIGVPPPAPPVTNQVYVDKTVAGCSDAGPGTAATPLCTITKGVSRLQAGYTLYIGDGIYSETIKPAVSGTATAPVTITSWPGRSPTVGVGITNGAYLSSKSYVTISNLTFANTTADGIYVTKSDHVTIKDNTVTGAGRPAQGQTAPGISMRGATASTVTGNNASRNNGHGIYLTSGSTGITVSNNQANFNAEGWQRNANGINVISPGNTLIRNVTHDNEDTGINFYTGGDNNLATLNVTYNNGDHGIDDLNVTGGRIIGNTVFRNCTSGINVEGTSSNYVVANNVAVDNAVYPAYNGISCARRAGNIGIWDSAPASTVVDHNLVHLTTTGTMYAWAGTKYTTLAAMQKATGQEPNGVQGDPKFLDAAGAKLALTEGSPAIDRGDSGVSGAQDTDILGAARVRDPNVDNSHASGPRLYDDLGAYEFQPSSAPASPNAALSLSPTSGTAPVAVTADASASTDPQGQTLSYAFDFGDGSSTGTQSTATAKHTYATAGTYTVRVTVENTAGLSSTATQKLTVDAPAAAPSARLSLNPTSGTAPVEVTADASASTDPQSQTLSYAFDFGDGSSTGTQAAATAKHTYTAGGTYTVKVTVTDTSGLADTTTQTVTVATPPSAPSARLSLSPTSGTAPVEVTADASASTDPQGQTLSYAFDFGDGTTTGTQAAATAKHTYTAGGTYTVKVTVTDTSGLADTTTQTVTVATPASAPSARLAVTPTGGTAPVQVTADAGGSTDPQGQALTYAFDFGDGTSAGPQPAATAGHSYTAAGTYVVQVTVTNTSGLTDTASQTVTVTPAPKAPTAKLSVTPTSGTAPVQVTADAGGSTDPQGQALTYAFDFGDGTSAGPQGAATAGHSYTAAGSYTVKVTVTNTSGLSDSATQSVTVAAPIQAPTAKLSVTPTSGTAPVQVTADAGGSTDPQGQTLSYAFDFGDGSTSGPQATATTTHTYPTAGTYTVKVTVTNTSGLSGTATQTVTVSAAPGYLGSLGTATSTTAQRTGTVTLTSPAEAGSMVVVSAQVAIGSNKPVTAVDDGGNVYSVAASQADSTGAKLTVLSAPVTKAMPAGSKITLTFQTATAYRLAADNLVGVSTVDRTSIATGKTAAFSSGATKATAVARELVFGVVALTGQSGAPAWASGWTDAGTASAGAGLVGRSWQASTKTGTFTASGTATGTWTAAVITFRP